MSNFDIEAYLNKIYATFPEARRRPLIGITANFSEGGDASLRDRYYNQVVRAGGTPVIIPPVADKDVIINTLENIDGLLLTGAQTSTLFGSGRNLHHVFMVSMQNATCPNCLLRVWHITAKFLS